MTRRVGLLVLAGCLIGAPGCLERRIHITSDPPGALVCVNDIEVGRTPVTTGFLFYGDFDVRARKEGYEPVSTDRDAWSPVWEMAPFDLAATAMPFTLRKTVEWHIDLKPVDPKLSEPEGLMARAREMQAKATPETQEKK
jgi:hypothetical protein